MIRLRQMLVIWIHVWIIQLEEEVFLILDWIAHPGKAWIRSQPYAGPYSPKKYVYYKSQENTFTDGSSWTRGYATMNYTIIRYADVLSDGC